MNVLVLLIVVVGAALRLWNVDAVGISHWDAGAFTAGPLGIGPYGKDYILPFYAPPFVPTLHHLALGLVRHADTVSVVLTALLGTLTLPVLYRSGRDFVGARAALLGTAALAGMEFHILYSRQPLTDVPFTLFFLLTLAALWRGWRRGERTAYLAAGVWAGACLMTKYHGFFPLVVFGLTLLATPLTRDEGPAPDGVRSAWRGLVLTGLVMAIPAAYLAWDIGSQIGFAEFRANRQSWLPELGLWLVPQTGQYLAQAFTHWTSPLVLAAAAAGLLVMLARRRPGDVLLLAWLGLFVATLPFYAKYPRLLVPMLPPLCLAAGVGLDGLWSRVRHRPAGTGALAAMALVLVAAGAWPARRTLEVSDRGYADAAAWLVEQDAGGEPDLLLTQHSILFYMHSAPNGFLAYDEAETVERLRTGRFRYLLTDLRFLKAPPDLREAFETWKPHLALEREIDNPLPDAFIVNLMGFDTLAALESGEADDELRDALTRIQVYANLLPGDD